MRIVIIIGLVIYIWATRHHQPAHASQEHQQKVFDAYIAMSVEAARAGDEVGSTYWHREASKSFIERYGEPPTFRTMANATKEGSSRIK